MTAATSKQWLLAVDPSIRSTGVALFRSGDLISADVIKASDAKASTADIGMRTLRMAQEVVAWVGGCDAAPGTLVGEYPQIYTTDKSKGDPNDLLALAGVGPILAIAEFELAV